MIDYCFEPDIVGPWVCKRLGVKYKQDHYSAIGKIVDGKIVCGVLYESYNGANIMQHIAANGSWADKTYLGLIFDYPFNQLGVRRISVGVCSTNQKSIDLVTRMGFNQEAKLQGATPDGDLLIFRMFKEDCKYLWGKYGKSVRQKYERTTGT